MLLLDLRCQFVDPTRNCLCGGELDLLLGLRERLRGDEQAYYQTCHQQLFIPNMRSWHCQSYLNLIRCTPAKHWLQRHANDKDDEESRGSIEKYFCLLSPGQGRRSERVLRGGTRTNLTLADRWAWSAMGKGKSKSILLGRPVRKRS